MSAACAGYGHLYRSETTLSRTGKPAVNRLLLALGERVFGFLDDCLLKLYAPTPQAAATAAEAFRPYVLPKAKERACFSVIGVSNEGPYTEDVFVERSAPVSTTDLALHYGPDFPTWEREGLQRLRQSRSGLSVLFGPPGCGKTSYLRALMSRLIGQPARSRDHPPGASDRGARVPPHDS